jgi:hypothetical protein
MLTLASILVWLLLVEMLKSFPRVRRSVLGVMVLLTVYGVFINCAIGITGTQDSYQFSNPESYNALKNRFERFVSLLK